MPTKPKLYITRAKHYIQKKLPKGAKVHGIYPRAVCAAVPAPLCAVFTTPIEDDTRPNPMKQQGESIHYLMIRDGLQCDLIDTKPPAIGEFKTLAYISYKNSGLWFAMAPIPFDL